MNSKKEDKDLERNRVAPKNVVVRAVSLPKGLDRIAEETRIKLGLSRSRFYETVLLDYLKSISVIGREAKKEAKEKEVKAKL